MKKTFMRTVGVLSTAAMLAVGAMSISASAEGTTTLSMDQIYAEPGQEVSFAMSIDNLDTSWTGLEFLVNYDARLEATLNKAGTAAACSYGDAIGDMAEELSRGGAVSKELTADGLKGFAFALGTATPISGNGQLCIFKFTVPGDAQPGDKFPVNLTVKDGGFIDANKENIAFETVNGWIAIKEESTTTSTEAASTTTTTTTEAAVVTSEAPAETTGAATTTAKPVEPPKTGVNGTALGIVGMLSAAAAAAVVLKKKND
ncbi:LPXTG cell wall anchor domain-containing protein [Ruminococcus sp.]|uniref:LPXTG cell wall anchor domain-containing protein n=1 Tax=Ruminococcus sp. TaxID=41978 RepID=UPI0025EE5BCE|nr:LPXTG cell wall anchor domain-containing protein [Ruminococcus sp.]MCI5815513.1 LPXTG cell wall anchor domain-containing protein [Ruminococcus sp.]